jgi:ribosomal protein S18 acetylase RimI-like enzyme
MKTDARLVPLIEELAANTWPALVQETLGEWRLRATFGLSKRANSVYTVGRLPDHGEWLKVVEDFYQRYAIPACFYVSDASPAELEGILETRGYKKVVECFLMTALSREVMESVERVDRFTYSFTSEAADGWIEDLIRLEQFSAERFREYAPIFSAIGPQKAFARILENGETIGLGTVVVERGWAGLSNIVIASAHRRKGAAAQLLRSLTDWASANGAQMMYLQVVHDNTAAITLYRKLGFHPISQHHYRMRSTE